MAGSLDRWAVAGRKSRAFGTLKFSSLDGKPTVLAGELTEWLCWVWLQLRVVGENLGDWFGGSLWKHAVGAKTSFLNHMGWLAGSLVGLSVWLAVLPGELTEWLF